MKVIVDVCCEVDYINGEAELIFEDGSYWSSPEFNNFNLEFEVISNHPELWPQIALIGTEENIRKYLEFYGWDDIDFIIEECQE